MSTLVPKRGAQLKTLPIGCSVIYSITLTDIPGPDPATWDTIRFSICDNGGGAYFTVPKASMTVTPSGTAGDYSVVLDIPVTEADSRLVDVGTGLRKFSLDFVSSGGYQDVLVDGTVPVYSPFVALP